MNGINKNEYYRFLKDIPCICAGLKRSCMQSLIESLSLEKVYSVTEKSIEIFITKRTCQKLKCILDSKMLDAIFINETPRSKLTRYLRGIL